MANRNPAISQAEQRVTCEGLELTPAAPVHESNRIVSIDVLRGFALLGILLMNIQSFSMPLAAYFNPAAYGDLHRVNYFAWLLVHVLIDEKFVVIFSMLFGAGILLMTSRLEASGVNSARLHYRRMAFLIAFGLLHGYLLWAGDILFDYGLCGLFVFLMRKKSARTLLLTAAFLISLLPTVLAINAHRLSKVPPERLAAMQAHWKPPAEEIARELTAYRGGWMQEMQYRVPQARQLELNGFLLRIFALMLIGMALLKIGYFTPAFPKRAYWLGVALGACVGVPLVLYGALLDSASDWDIRTAWFNGLQYNYWGSLVISFGWISLVMLAVRAQLFPALLSRIQAVGRTAFSNYILQSIICTFIFYGYGLGLFGRVSRAAQLAIVALVWAIQLTISPIWMKHYQFGPLEWLWRSLTYARREPFRRPSIRSDSVRGLEVEAKPQR